MGRRTLWIVGVTAFSMFVFDLAGAFSNSANAAGTNDHFASRRRAVAQAQQQRQGMARAPWGGPTTGRNWWTPVQQHNYRISTPGTFIMTPGYYGPYQAYPQQFYYGPNFYGPTYWPARQIYIERRIELRR